MKLNLGHSTSFPFVDINTIKKLSKNFNSLQIMFNYGSSLTDAKINTSKQLFLDIKPLYSNIYLHLSYQINIGAELIPTHQGLYNRSLELALEEINFASELGIKYVVLHMGSNVKKQYETDDVYNYMVQFVVILFEKLNNIDIQVLFETPTGRGGEMCWNLNEFVQFIQNFSSQNFYHKIGICIDTCHIFQADYNINSNKIIKQVHQIFLPIENKIKLIHLNDSFHSCGKHKDVHAQLTRGKIKINKLIKFIYPYRKLSMILETHPPYNYQIKSLQQI